MPADIKSCFRMGGVVPPDRDLTVFDVESLWKKDKVRIVILQQCGNRFMTWYETLRKEWR